MSNGEDVLDDWEEIDEAGLTNTLQKIQAERNKTPPIVTAVSIANSLQNNTILTTTPVNLTYSCSDTLSDNTLQPMKLLQRNPNQNANGTTTTTPTTNNANKSSMDGPTISSNEADTVKSPLDDMASTFQPVLMVLHKTNDEYQSANYIQPMQTVKILRRPTQSSDRRNNDQRPKQPIKTLQQREQEYAEARLRILGSAKNPEDDVVTVTPEMNSIDPPSSTSIATTSTATITTASPTIARTNSLPKIQQQQQQQTTAGNVCIGNSNNVLTTQPNASQIKFNNHYYMQQQLLQQQANFYYQQHYPQQQIPPQLQLQPAYNINNRTLSMPVMGAQASSGAPLTQAAITGNNRNLQQQQQQLKYHQQKQQTWTSTATPTAVTTAAVATTTAATIRQQQQESILRLPRGPDGSVGFQMRR